jgi:2-C-methyl-D-erythritol 4-phosphate cytidylyltransferase
VPEPPRVAVLLLAAGSGTRVGSGTNKVLLPLAGVPVLGRSLHTVARLPWVGAVVVVARADDADAVAGLVRQHLPAGRSVGLVVGGESRHASEWRGLAALRPAVGRGEVDVVAVHDAARPLAGAGLFEATARAAAAYGGGVPVRPQPGLVTRSLDASVTGLGGVQTPQAFRAGPLLDAYERADRDGFVGTDTAACFAAYTDLPVVAVPTEATNLKITFPEDVAAAEVLLPIGPR